MIDELLVRYFSREATEEELATIAAWLDESAENKAYFASMENVWNLTHPACNPEDIHTMEALGKMESMMGFLEEPDIKVVRRRKVFRIVERVAACLAIPLIALSSYLLLRPKNDLFVPQDECSMVEVRTIAGMTGQVSLPDGSQVWLNSNSVLSYPAVFGSDCREVRLDGEGYFKVEKDSSRPFFVHCPKQLISVLGTEFDVEAYSDNPCTVTSLLSGSISLQSESGSEYFMKPGQMAHVDSKGNVDIKPEEGSMVGAWRNNKISFSETSLPNALRLIGNRYGVHFVLQNDNLKTHKINGTVSGQSLESVLSHLSYISGIRFVRSDDTTSNSRELIKVY